MLIKYFYEVIELEKHGLSTLTHVLIYIPALSYNQFLIKNYFVVLPISLFALRQYNGLNFIQNEKLEFQSQTGFASIFKTNGQNFL